MTSGLYATKLKPRKQKKLFGSPKKKSFFTPKTSKKQKIHFGKPLGSSEKRQKQSYRRKTVSGIKKSGRKALRKLI